MPRFCDLSEEQVENLDPESLKYFKDKEEITDEEYKELQNSSEKYDRMMARRYDGIGHAEWLERVKTDIAMNDDYYESEEYMNKVWDWHYNCNETCFKWDDSNALSRPFKPKEATLWKYRTLPKQFRDHGIIWMLMEHTFNLSTSKYGPVKQLNKTKKKVTKLEDKVDKLQIEVKNMKKEIEELKEQIQEITGPDFQERFNEMKKELKELRAYKKEQEDLEKEIYAFSSHK